MKRKVKVESILVLVLSIMCITLSILLMISINKNKKNNKECSVEEKNNISTKTEVVCGDDNDISRFMCARYHENGYIITLGKNVDDNEGFNAINELINNVGGIPAMYVSKIEINTILRNIYSIQEEKDFGIDSFIFIPDYNVDYKKLESAVKSNKKLDKIVKFKTSNK